MFINPTKKEVTVHKNSKLGEFYTVKESKINEVNTSTNCEPKQSPEPKVDLSKDDITDSQKQQLRSLINEFKDCFADDISQLGQASQS